MCSYAVAGLMYFPTPSLKVFGACSSLAFLRETLPCCRSSSCFCCSFSRSAAIWKNTNHVRAHSTAEDTEKLTPRDFSLSNRYSCADTFITRPTFQMHELQVVRLYRMPLDKDSNATCSDMRDRLRCDVAPS